MPSFKPTGLWNAEPHTLAKVEIVRRYLFLWFSILGTKNNRLVYIDGFAGPGRYANSEQSSPTAALMAARAALEALARSGRAPTEWLFYFIERENEFASSLRNVIAETAWPKEFKCEVQIGTFERKLVGILDETKRLPSGMPPTFAFIDPFGATGVPFAHVTAILKHRGCEILINLDSDGIGRLAAAQSVDKNKEHLDAIFGGPTWREKLDAHAPMPVLCAQVLALYKARLRSLPNVNYNFAFAMKSTREALNYHLVFASQHPLGLRKMKEAMKAVDQSGSYSFSDDTIGQAYLFDFSDPAEPANKMLGELGGSWHPYRQFDDFALNESPFGNPKSMLKYLKSQGKVEIQWLGEPSRTGFPEDRIKFIKLNP
jgi:three-Cys-motif partner protein